MLSKKGTVARIYLPPDANCLLSVADHCLRSRNYVNLIVIDKQPQLQWLDMEAARAALRARRVGLAVGEQRAERRCGRPTSCWPRPATSPTLEALAAAACCGATCPSCEVRVVNVVDLMTLFPPDRHPHGMTAPAFVELFTDDVDVVFAFHGYQRAIHQLIHGRPHAERFHVRGFKEEGTTTTPFDMVVRNEISRYHLALEAVRRARRAPVGGDVLVRHCREMLDRHRRTSASTRGPARGASTGAGAGERRRHPVRQRGVLVAQGCALRRRQSWTASWASGSGACLARANAAGGGRRHDSGPRRRAGGCSPGEGLPAPAAVGHRVVHGGPSHVGAGA